MRNILLSQEPNSDNSVGKVTDQPATKYLTQARNPIDNFLIKIKMYFQPSNYISLELKNMYLALTNHDNLLYDSTVKY